MRTVEECYEYVIKRRGELAAQRRRKRGLALKAAVPVCGIAVIAGSIAVYAARTAYNGKPETSNIYSDMELVKPGMADRRTANDLEELKKYSDIAVVGEFIDNSVSDIKYEYSDFFKKDIITFVRSYNVIEVKQVLMGDVKVGDKLTVTQLEGSVDGKMYSWSELTPMTKGDEWIFFLNWDDKGYYWVTCDSDGRYPTKNSAEKNRRITFRNVDFSENYQLGVYDKQSFNQSIYDEIVEKYDV